MSSGDVLAPLRLQLSAIRIHVHHTHFRAAVVPYDSRVLASLRKREDIFVSRRRGMRIDRQVVVVPFGENASREFRPAVNISIHEEPEIVAQLIEQQLPGVFHELRLVDSDQGPQAIRASEDWLADALRTTGATPHPALAMLHQHPAYRIRVRYEHLGVAPMFLATIDFRSAVVCSASLEQLRHKGADIDGLIVGRIGHIGQYPIGVVRRVQGSHAVVSFREELLHLTLEECTPFPSVQTMDALLSRCLDEGDRARVRSALGAIEVEATRGLELERKLQEVAQQCAALGVREVAPDLSVELGSVVDANHDTATRLRAPSFRVGSSRVDSDGDSGHVAGVARCGPSTRAALGDTLVRIAVFTPRSVRDDARRFADALVDGASAAVESPLARRGLIETYGFRGATVQTIVIDDDADAAAYLAAVEQRLDPSCSPDIAFVVFADQRRRRDVDQVLVPLHAALLGRGIPLQRVRVSRLQGGDVKLTRLLEDMSIAAYTHLGGMPWTLADATVPDELVVGLGYGVWGRGRSKRARAVATVFRQDGTFIEAAHSPRVTIDGFARTLGQTIQRALARHASSRVVFHALPFFERTDLPDVMREARTVVREMAVVVVRAEHALYMFDASSTDRAPPPGTVVQLGPAKSLLSVEWRSAELPRPLLLEMHGAPQGSSIIPLTTQLFELTRMRMRASNVLREPVTLHYARELAKLLGQLDELVGDTDERLERAPRRGLWFL